MRTKLFRGIIAATVGLVMAIGVGVGISHNIRKTEPVYAAEVQTYVLSGTTTSTGTTYNGENAVTQGGVTWNVNGNVNQNPWRIGGNKNNGLSSAGAIRHIQSQASVSSYDITKVVVTSAKPASNSIDPTNVSLKVGTSAGASDTNSLSNGSWAASVTFNRPNGKDWSSKYFEIDFTMPANTTTTNKFITITSVAFYYENGGDAPTFTVTYNNTNATSGLVPVDETEYESGENINVAANTGSLARTGFVWAGWSLNEDGSGEPYGPAYNTTYSVALDDINFYPIWKAPLPEEGTITFDADKYSNSYSDIEKLCVLEEDSTSNSSFALKYSNVIKGTGDNAGKIQFRANNGSLYSTIPLPYLRNIEVTGDGNNDAVILYGTEPDNGCDSDEIGTKNTYFKITNGSNSPRYWIITVTYALEDPAVLTDLVITSGADSVRKIYDDGDAFDPTGLVINAEWNNVLDGENDLVSNVVWTPSILTSGTSSVTGTYTFGPYSDTVTVSGLTVTAPNFVHTYASNSVYNQTTGNSSEERTHTPTSGPEYVTLGGYNYSGNDGCMSFMDVDGMYLGNNEEYIVESVKKNIRKIVIDLHSGSDASKLTMTEGQTVLPTTTTIVPTISNNNKTLTYVFSDSNPFFKLTKSSTYFVNLKSIKVFTGSNVPVVDEVYADIKSGTYYEGATLSASDFEVLVSWTGGKADTAPTEGFTWIIGDGSSNVLSVGNNSVKVVYQGVESNSFNVVAEPASAQDVIENTLTTQSSLSYHYSKNVNTVTDIITKDLIDISGNSYKAWSGKSDKSDAIYAGNSFGNADSLQLKTKDNISGIVTTSSGGFASKITVAWNSGTAAGRVLDIYGKDTGYTGASQLYDDETKGTKIGSITYGTSTTLTINDEYEYIGIKSSDGALYLDSIEIDWTVGYTYNYSNMAIRFGGFMTQDLWDELDTNEHNIEGYGVLLTTDDVVGENDDIADAYSLAPLSNEVTDYYSGDITPDPKSVPSEATAAQKASHGVEGDYYIWNLYFDIDEADYDTTYVAGAYIKLKNGDVVFMKKASFSVYSLAADYIANRGYNDSTAGGSLGDLASHA